MAKITISAERAARRLFEEKFFGSAEPSNTTHLADALTWYQYMTEDSVAKDWLIEFLKAADRPEDAANIARAPDNWDCLPRTACFLARLALRGYPLNDHSINIIEAQLDAALGKLSTMPLLADAPMAVLVKPNVQVFIREKASELIGELEGMIDDGLITPEWSLIKYLQDNRISSVVASKLVPHFAPIAAEYTAALEGNDPELSEAYPDIDDLTNRALIYTTLEIDAYNYANATKKAIVRKPRKRKPEQILKHFKVSDASIVDPKEILGAKELWTFNPNNMILTVYRAADSDGLIVKRQSIVNINETTSSAKRLTKKADVVVEIVCNAGKVELRHLMNEIKGKSKPAKKPTKDTVLLRVVR